MWRATRLRAAMLPDNNTGVTITLYELMQGGFCPWDHDDPFPIWDEAHRPELQKKIIEHYLFRQIGFETAGRFKFELNKMLREIMPRYVKIWATTQYTYNPIENYNMREGSTDVTDDKSTDKRGGLSQFLDTPAGPVTDLDKYVTNATKDDASGETKHDGKFVHEAHRNGNIGVTTTQQMIEQERNITIDVDMQIINDLNVLFLGVY